MSGGSPRPGKNSEPPAPAVSPASERPKARQDTQPFVPDTVRMSGLAVPVGVPSQARSTPLPKPAPSSLQAAHIPGKKKKRESSLLGLIVPSLGRRGGSAPQPPARADRTLDVSETDLSLVESSTTELTLSDLSGLADMPRADASHEPPPPLPRSPFRRQNPWLVWGLVGGAWCVMIALALLAVDEEPAKQPLRAEQRTATAPVAQVGASAPAKAPEAPALAVSNPATLAPGEGPAKGVEPPTTTPEPPAPSVPEATTAQGELTPPAALVHESSSSDDSKHKARAHKRSERQKKAAAQKRKRAAKRRAAKRAAAAAQE